MKRTVAIPIDPLPFEPITTGMRKTYESGEIYDEELLDDSKGKLWTQYHKG